MKNTTGSIFLLLFMVSAAEMSVAADGSTAAEIRSTKTSESSLKRASVAGEDAIESTEQVDSNLVREAAERRTPPWTNDSANINNKLPPTVPYDVVAKPYSAADLTVKPEWKKLFSNDAKFSTTTGKELYQNMCQACHMPDGQGAKGAGIYPSFVGNERLRSPYYPADVVLNGLRGMPSFGEMLSNQQIADVVNFLRTDFGNKLAGEMTGEDVARVRH